MDKLYKHDGFHNYVIKSSSKHIDLIDAAKLILRFNETIQLDGDWQIVTITKSWNWAV